MKESSGIERKYILSETLPVLLEPKSKPLQMGCLSAHGNREVFVCRVGSSFFLRTREGRQRFRREVDIPLGRSHFEALWKQTEGARLAKTTQQYHQEGLSFTVETVHGGKFTLIMAVVQFAKPQLAKSFKPPVFFGPEITNLSEYSDAHLALHGIPPLHNGKSQAGALPFLFKNGVLHIVLVTSSSGTRWIVPKGGLEKHITRQEVALMEAAEEAGAIGTIEPGLKAECRMADGRTLHLYPLRVSVLLPFWPERLARRRVVLPIYRAILRICDVGLKQAIQRMAREIEP